MTVQRYKGDQHMKDAHKDPEGDFVEYTDYEKLYNRYELLKKAYTVVCSMARDDVLSKLNDGTSGFLQRNSLSRSPGSDQDE
jgi:hypothetical protein